MLITIWIKKRKKSHARRIRAIAVNIHFSKTFPTGELGMSLHPTCFFSQRNHNSPYGHNLRQKKYAQTSHLDRQGRQAMTRKR